MNRVIFLIDGFNLYHSICDIQKLPKNLSLKWLNIYSFCSSFLQLIDSKARLKEIYYFSAYATHLNDLGIINRHMNYIKCLESTGVIPILARFKPKTITCAHCGRHFVKHEEKETDVAIAAKLLEVFSKNECETVVLITGDTDIIPAIKSARSLFCGKTILCAFPFGRKNKELVSVAPKSFKIHVNSYINNQFPDPVVLSNGEKIYKPSSW